MYVQCSRQFGMDRWMEIRSDENESRGGSTRREFIGGQVGRKRGVGDKAECRRRQPGTEVREIRGGGEARRAAACRGPANYYLP